MASTRPEVATLALFLCGGKQDAVHTEDVALRAAKIVPGMFAWEKHADRVDKELVRVALSDARLKKGYVLGSHDKGWMLTADGLQFSERAVASLDGAAVASLRARTQQQANRHRARLTSTVAFEKFTAGRASDITDDEADNFFRLNVYVRAQARQRKIARIENEFADDPDLAGVVALLATQARRRD
jgi:hypothetical protein